MSKMIHTLILRSILYERKIIVLSRKISALENSYEQRKKQLQRQIGNL